MLSLEGKQLGNYDVVRRISVGGMGAVYEGRQRTAFDRRVAIKVILGDYASDRDMRRRFAREARTIARLHHPHILQLIEFGDEQGILYLVMPYVEGGTLTRYLRRSLPDLNEVGAIYRQLLDAVEHAHEQGLIHRDIKSSNVLLEMHRTGLPYVYLADFGLVRSMRQAELEQTEKTIPLDQVPGTPHYMAPEQTRGIVTPQTDIYALGVLLYQMLTGNLPYEAPDDIHVIHKHLHAPIPRPSEQDASIPPEMDEVVRKAMAKRPEDRYRSIAELRAAFFSAIKGPVATIPALDDVEEVLQEDEEEQPAQVVPKRGQPMPIDLQEPRDPEQGERKRGPRRLRQVALPAAAIRQRPARMVKVRNTDSVKPGRHVPRITEEPALRGRKRLSIWAVASILVSVLLLILVLMPRAFGISLFPAGFPLFGTPPVATITITAQSKTLQDRYVLTASPKVKTPDVTTHTIPAHTIQDEINDTTLISTTGRKTIGAAPSHGVVVFTNNGNSTVSVPASFTLTTASGIHIQLTQGKDVPPRHDGEAGTASVPAVAVAPGSSGNIPAHALDGTCCTNSLTAKNPDPFTGGVDPQEVHTLTQADLDNAKASLSPRLQQQLAKQLPQKLAPGEVVAGQPAYQVTATTKDTVGAQIDQTQVNVNVKETATAYNRSSAVVMAIQLLSKQASQTLDKAFQLQGTPTIIGTPSVETSKGDTIYLSVSVRGTWVYKLAPAQVQQWSQSIKGATQAAASAYLKQQPGIASVIIQLPFNTDHLPTSSDDIKIVIK